MLATFNAMLKEEWRVHSLLFGNRNFSFFPIILLVGAFIASMFLPYYQFLFGSAQMVSMVHLIYLFFGLSVGGFGFLGQEALNRRLGDVSLIAYASRTLPISERRIFANFVAKDTFFYLMFLVIPFILGYAPARAFLGMPLDGVPYLAASITLTFLLGLSLSFFVSTAYAHYGKKLLAFLFIVTFSYTLFDGSWLTLDGLSSKLPTAQYYLGRSVAALSYSILLITVLCGLSFIFLKVDYHLAARRYNEQYSALSKKLKLGRYSMFVAKDLLDLNRSEGGLGKVVFSYAFPLAAITVVMMFFSHLLPLQGHHMLLMIALITGLISTSLYNWLTELDFQELYMFLPLRTSYLIRAKLVLYASVTAVTGSLIILIAYLLIKPPPIYLPLSLLLAAAVASYTTSVTVYLAGLRPNVMLYSGKLFLAYSSAILPLLLVPAVAFMTGYASHQLSISLVLLCCFVMLPTAKILLEKSYLKWDNEFAALF